MTVEVLIRAVNNPTSAQDLVKNVAQLAATKDEQAIPTLVEVLKFNNPGAAVAAVNGLINIGEAVVPYLLENVDGYNYGARAWMLRVFAGIGDPRALDLLIEAANKDFAFSVRRSAAKGLGNIQWQKVPDSEREIQQQKVCDCLFLALEDGEWVVRYGAIAGLEGLACSINDTQKMLIKEKLQVFMNSEPEAGVRARIEKAINTLT
ncbi:phycocyanobilin lyase [Picosynechococcus sp. PCC 7003]|uniref:HEAT repeat domain-containing protein n=1 Tax=Picosynechococcus sp. PCC 7003 TaxID=374981 RepID=UPI000810746B|nr:HEAT repeat domain-containing protein [Picosynechococcus sp. PCC 7003]ANV84894.1 phycocyanobilin lyase [Picosynechococcus sp. PCC 7003]